MKRQTRIIGKRVTAIALTAFMLAGMFAVAQDVKDQATAWDPVISGPATDADGEFTLTWTVSDVPGLWQYELRESTDNFVSDDRMINDGGAGYNTQEFGGASGFAARTPGTYYYRVKAYGSEPTNFSAIHQVVVGIVLLPHAPICINSDADFYTASGVTPGDGTAGNPHIIENWEIDASAVPFGIYIGNTTEHFVVRNCAITGGHDLAGEYGTASGIALYNVANGKLENNICQTNSDVANLGIGIKLKDTSGVHIIGNDCILQNKTGIYLEGSTDNIIEGNNCSDNTNIGGGGMGIHMASFSHNNTVLDNICHGNAQSQVAISYSSNGNRIGSNNITGGQYGIQLYGTEGCGNIEIIGNTIFGITLGYAIDLGEASYNCMVTDNAIFSNGVGIGLTAGTNNNTVYANTLISNSYGIRLLECQDNVVMGNRLESNTVAGVRVQSPAVRNTVYNNNFIDNVDHAIDEVGGNFWDNGPPDGGNHYNNYTTPDANADGFVDNPYIITGAGGAQDNYPLVAEYVPSIPKPVFLSPANCTANVTGSYTLTWSSGAQDGFHIQECYGGPQNFAAPTFQDNVTTPSLAVSGKTTLGEYWYRVRAFVGAEYSDWSEYWMINVCGRPGITVPATAPYGDFSVNWTAPDGPLSGFNGFQLFQSTDNATWTPFGMVMTLSQEFIGKAPGTWYYYVRAHSSLGSYVDSEVMECVVPPYFAAPFTQCMPTSSHDGKFTVSWGLVPAATNYLVEEAKDIDFTVNRTELYNGTSTVPIEVEKPNGTYYYRAKCWNATQDSNWGNVAQCNVSILTEFGPAPVLTGPAIVAAGNYTINWTASPGAAYYEIYRTPDANLAPLNLFDDSTTNLHKNITNPANGTYYYGVRAYKENATQVITYWTNMSNILSVDVGSANIDTPVFGANMTSDDDFTLNWTKPVNMGTGGNFFIWESAHPNWVSPTVYAPKNTQVSWSFTNKTNGTYYYQIRAQNRTEFSRWSQTITVVIGSQAPQLAAPMLYGPGNSANGTYIINWTAVADATNYILEEADNPDFDDPVIIEDGLVTSALIMARANGTYYYRVKAMGANPSPWSNVVSVVVSIAVAEPLGVPVLTVPASSITGTYLVTWTAISGATGYKLMESTVPTFEGATPLSLTDTQKLFSGKANGTYYYKVKAYNATEEGEWSDIDNITVLLEYPDQPIEVTLNGVTLTLYVGIPVPITIGGVEHTITVLSITGNGAVVEIRSTPQQVPLTIGESKEIDTDGNGKADLQVTLDSITNGAVSLTVKPITEEADKGSSNAMMLIVVVVIAVLLVVVMLFFRSKVGNAQPEQKPEERGPEETDQTKAASTEEKAE
ncbi:MAG: NosD domain-containing protein [Thermoplasmata archaeon]